MKVKQSIFSVLVAVFTTVLILFGGGYFAIAYFIDQARQQALQSPQTTIDDNVILEPEFELSESQIQNFKNSYSLKPVNANSMETTINQQLDGDSIAVENGPIGMIRYSLGVPGTDDYATMTITSRDLDLTNRQLAHLDNLQRLLDREVDLVQENVGEIIQDPFRMNNILQNKEVFYEVEGKFVENVDQSMVYVTNDEIGISGASPTVSIFGRRGNEYFLMENVLYTELESIQQYLDPKREECFARESGVDYREVDYQADYMCYITKILSDEEIEMQISQAVDNLLDSFTILPEND